MKKINKLGKVLMLILILTITVPILQPYNIIKVEAATVKINKTKITLIVGETSVLKLTGTSKAVKWSSSKKSVATVSSKGKVTAKKEGTTNITATVNNKKYTCKVTVKDNVISDENLAAYSWILLENKFSDEKLTINKIQIGKDKDSDERAVIINYTYNTKKRYAYIRLRAGKAESSEYFVIYQLESDEFPDQHLNLNTFSNLSDLENNATIDDTLDIKDVKKLYNEFIEKNEYLIIS